MFKTILMPELEQAMKQGVVHILDVREMDEFEQGHIAGAMLAPTSTFGEHLPKLDKNKLYYVVCHSGNRSRAVAEFLGKKGYQVINVMGGMSTYRGSLVFGKK